MSNQFKQRLLMSLFSVLGLSISIYYSYTPFFKPIFILLSAGVISFALAEYYHLARNKGFHPSAVSGISISVIYTIAIGLSFYYPGLSAFSWLALLFSCITLFLTFFNQQASSLGNLAVTLFGIFYLTLPISCGLRINYFFPESALSDGRLWLTYVLLVTKMTDIGGYFCGKMLGKNKLAPTISPKKTVEGALGGLSASLLTSLIFSIVVSLFTLFKMTLFQSIWIGLTISILAQLGDLSESLLKRDAGVKDSSHLPGLGGMLDILDSLVFTLPFLYLLLKMGVIG
ncbi:MAG: phosphatidate cytidylyltransferase [Parachlamydiaceae bacterium]